jgi:phenylacetate-CoA ligase
MAREPALRMPAPSFSPEKKSMPLHATRTILKAYQALTGRRILQRFDELERSQWLPREELLALQRAKLQTVVEYAYHKVPYYRESFKEAGFHPDDLRRDPSCFQKLPFVTKRIMREQSEQFFSEDPALRRSLRPHYTSGSTGEPFTFWEDHNQRDHVTAGIFRSLTWFGWRLGEPHGYLWGSSNLEWTPWQHRLRERMLRLCFNQFVVGAFDLSPENLDELARRIRVRRPRVLTGYTGALCVFAQYVKERKLSDLKLPAICSTSEVLYPHQRRLLEEVFGCPVFNRYATTEIGMIGYECEAHAGLHVSVESSYLEILQGELPVADGEPGELVVTNLNNFGFPFIRYRLKDIVTGQVGPCRCGRQSPLIECVQGRTVDIFRTSEGNPVWGDLDPALFQVEHVRLSQVIQKALDLVLVRIVRDDGFSEKETLQIENVIKRLLGQAVRVQFEFPDSIPQLKSGKFRYAYSELPEFTPDKQDSH